MILISQVCVIIHSNVVDMQRSGELSAVIDQHGNTGDAVSEFDLSTSTDVQKVPSASDGSTKNNILETKHAIQTQRPHQKPVGARRTLKEAFVSSLV